MSSRFSGASQSTRRIAVKTPLPENQLLFRQMSMTEELSRLFQMDLSLLSISPDINLDDLLGKNITIRLQRPDGDMRFFNGFASRAAFGGTEDDFFRYDLVLRPWFWFLTRTSDCRIFQEKTVPEIIEEVLGDQGFSDYENKLSGQYRTWEYCVQYRESDFNFLSRLMEQEGIYFFFRHEDGRHVLVLCDGVGSHTTVPGYAQIPFYPADGNRRRRDRDHFWHWSASRQLQSGTYALNDFNFKTPFADLQVKSTVSNPHAQADYEVYDYPGEYTERGEGEAYSKARIEETQQPYQLAAGQGDVAGIETGALFTLENHGRDDQNIEYIIVSAQHHLSQGDYQTNGSEDDDEYQVSIQAMDSKLPYRAQRSTPKPTVQGPQTAMVVGKEGEEIWTDQYGRVKVQFHWDRYSQGDETSSCWIRVAQVWAGKNWGGMFIPRIGHEVIVEFLEGDPDRPIITGRVYNAAAMPPYGLPGEATTSTIQSNSSKGGGGFNELRFEDKKGEEEVFLHAQKNMEVIIKNQCREYTGSDHHKVVGHKRYELTKNEFHYTHESDRFDKTAGNVNITIESDRKTAIQGSAHLSVDAGEYTQVGADSNKNVGGNDSYQAGGTFSIKAGKEFHQKSGNLTVIDAGSEVHVKSGGKLILDAGAQLSLKVGGNFIDINPGGIFIKGNMVMINSGGSAGCGEDCDPKTPAAPQKPDEPKETSYATNTKKGK